MHGLAPRLKIPEMYLCLPLSLSSPCHLRQQPGKLLLSPHQGTFDPAIKLKFCERLPNTPEISNNAKVLLSFIIVE